MSEARILSTITIRGMSVVSLRLEIFSNTLDTSTLKGIGQCVRADVSGACSLLITQRLALAYYYY